MLIILLILICLTLGIACLAYMYRHSQKDHIQQDDSIESVALTERQCETECGDASCTLDCLPNIPKDNPIYFDDEELDKFKGKASSGYSENETEQFSEVLYTMKEEEVPEWLSSLQQREVELPDGLKDEIYIILHELRKQEQNTK